MKRLLLAILLFTSICATSFAGPAKKPTLMILPSDHWCEQRYYMKNWSNQGLTIKTPDYQTAFIQDRELSQVISKIGQLLTERDYSLKDAEQETKAVFNRITEGQVTISKTSGSTLAETPLDMLKKRAKMDILIQIDWTINSNRSISFTLEAFDSYTSKRIATSTGTSKPSNDIIPILLETAIKSNIKDFDKQIDKYYADTNKNGREIILTIKCWETWEGDLELENEDGEELLDVIQKWLRKNTINGVFNLSDATENFAQFEQVRIPLCNEDGDAIDARYFANQIRKFLNKECNITSKVMTRGLGEAMIVIGEK